MSARNFTERVGCSWGWGLYCSVVSTFGLTAYYADIFRRYVPDWIGVGVLIAPVAIITFIQWGEASDRVVSISHTIAASWFALMAAGMEVGICLGYEPPGSTFYRILSHLGWTFAWAGIYRRARLNARREDQDAG